ncbi:MAG: translation initiation factor IF-3 [Patescibacteria group bacterium]
MRKTFFRKPEKKKLTRINEMIRIDQVRVIDEKGENLGIIDTSKALSIAKERLLDLVEISPTANPPVCKITDYGKYQYSEEKKQRKMKAKQKKFELKGIRIGFNTSSHDLETRVKQIEKFLKLGHKVRIEMRLKGRERGRKYIAKEKLDNFIETISLDVKKEEETKNNPRGIAITICLEKPTNQ